MEFIPHVIYDMIYSSLESVLPKFVIDSVIIFFNKIVWTPILLLESLTLMVSFWISLFLRHFNFIHKIEELNDFIDRVVLTRYTMVTRRIHMAKNKVPKQFTPSMCFMGGGQLWMFAIGVGHYVYETYDVSKITFLASSCGCYAAVPLACGLDPYEWCKRDWGKCMRHFTSRGVLGCFFDSKEFYFNLWDDYLPTDAHVRCSGHLFISVTIFPSLQNRVISEFPTRRDLINAIVASMCLPFVFIRDFPVALSSDIGLCIDGGFSNDSPCLDTYTITVSALHKEADIQPRLGRTQLQCELITCNDSDCDSSSSSCSGGSSARRVGGYDSDGDADEGDAFKGGINSKGDDTVSGNESDGDGDGDGDGWLQRQLTEEVRLGPRIITTACPNKEGVTLVSQKVPSPVPSENETTTCGSSSSSSSSNHKNNPMTNKTSSSSNTATAASASASAHKQVPVATQRYYESLGYDTYEQYRNRLKPSDIIKTPTYERVWEVGGMGMKSAAQCVDFTRHEWQTILRRRRKQQQPPEQGQEV